LISAKVALHRSWNATADAAPGQMPQSAIRSILRGTIFGIGSALVCWCNRANETANNGSRQSARRGPSGKRCARSDGVGKSPKRSSD
jgi:hypothetical protein